MSGSVFDFSFLSWVLGLCISVFLIVFSVNSLVFSSWAGGFNFFVFVFAVFLLCVFLLPVFS